MIFQCVSHGLTKQKVYYYYYYHYYYYYYYNCGLLAVESLLVRWSQMSFLIMVSVATPGRTVLTKEPMC